uniref:Uncharacterized protein n=1 Tax=viral metagenome TaxID=1070528 RepID=A0A6M3LZA9_9ZZZZ
MGDYMKDNLSGEKIGFTQGVVYAVALCIRNFCEGGAELIWKESNFNFSDLSVCDDYDSTVVLKYFKKFAKEQGDSAYSEIARRDFEREIYKQCDKEDAAKLNGCR